jgi:hypothetical protein
MFLAMSAALAGYCLFRFYANTAGNQLVLPYLLLAAALLSLADSAWQAIFAAAEAKMAGAGHEGGLSPTAAFLAAVFASLAGLMCAMTGGFNSFRAGGALLMAILARHCLFRRLEIVSPLLGGLAAAMFMVIGMTAHPAFIEMLHVREIRVPATFFALYMTVAQVVAMTGEAPRRRPSPDGGGEPAETAYGRLAEPREEGVSRSVVGFGGAVLVVMPPILGWIMPWSWLSWTFLGFLALSLAVALAPALVYRTRRDLAAFVAAAQRGGVFLSAGAVASLGDYLPRDIYEGWVVPMPGRDELAATIIIIALAAPAWFARRQAGTVG